MKKITSLIIAAILMTGAVQAAAGGAEGPESSSWSMKMHEENSLTASVLYVPCLVFSIPYRLIDGILNPKPVSQATIPPAAHQVR